MPSCRRTFPIFTGRQNGLLDESSLVTAGTWNLDRISRAKLQNLHPFGDHTKQNLVRILKMKNFAESIKTFLKEEDGPTAVEYAVMLALIVVVCMGTIQTLGSNANDKFIEVSDQIAAN